MIKWPHPPKKINILTSGSPRVSFLVGWNSEFSRSGDGFWLPIHPAIEFCTLVQAKDLEKELLALGKTKTALKEDGQTVEGISDLAMIWWSQCLWWFSLGLAMSICISIHEVHFVRPMGPWAHGSFRTLSWSHLDIFRYPWPWNCIRPQECDFLLGNFDLRQEAREQEMFNLRLCSKDWLIICLG